MKKTRLVSGVLATLMMLGQLSWVGLAAADTTGGTPTPTQTVAPTATATPVPTAAPSPTAASTPTPAPSPTTVQAAAPSPVATAAPEPTAPSEAPSPKATAAAPAPTTAPDQPLTVKKDLQATGADGCGGVVPRWVFDTAGRAWVEADKSSFACDKASGYYLSPKYYYDKRIGWYEIIPDTAPKPDYMITAPNVIHTVLGDMVVGSPDYQAAKALGLLGGPGGAGILLPAGASAPAGGAAPAAGQSWFDLTNLVNVVNILQSNATSGNAAAGSNTRVGNVGSGAASVVANLINLLASAWSWSNGSLNFFMQNILAPMTGDIHLNPMAVTTGGGGALGNANINGTGSGSTNAIDINNPNSLNVNAKSTGSITNNVNVNALSGGASANKNTQVGNVTTGAARAQVNIINLINSFITSGSSFFGILNIIGKLNGDILFPTGFLNGLVPAGSAPASTTAAINGTGAGSANQIGVNNATSATINNATSNSVTNNILTAAASGSANAGSNTLAGGVKSGAASTNQSLFNMANSSIFGDNAVLVMVNVLGHWVGKIMTLPGTGASQAALLTGNAAATANGPTTTAGISATGANSNNQIAADNSSKAIINQQATGTITNNVSVNAQSGDASAMANTKVGNVESGTAQAGSSVANLFNTVLNVKHWFGVLVINVFGDWTGDVNHDSAAGGYSTDGAGAGAGAPAAAVQSGFTAAAQPAGTQLPSVGLLAMVGAGAPSAGVSHASGGGIEAAVEPENTGRVLTAAAETSPAAGTAAAAAQSHNLSFLFIASALVMLIAGALLTIEKKLRR